MSSHFPVLSSFMTYQRVCNWIDATGATSGTGTAYPFGTPDFTPGFYWGYFALCVCCVDRCLSFCPFSIGLVLSVLHQYTDSEYPFLWYLQTLLKCNCLVISSSTYLQGLLLVNFSFTGMVPTKITLNFLPRTN